MGNRATFEIEGCDVVLYSHWGGDLSWLMTALQRLVDAERGALPVSPSNLLARGDADHLILVAAKEGGFDRAWAKKAVYPDVGDNGHYVLHAPEGAPTSEWTLERIPEVTRLEDA